MIVKSSKVMILSEPLEKWDSRNRATVEDPEIGIPINPDAKINDVRYTLMTRKLHSILRDYDERVAISNSLVLDILDNYMKKSHRLKRVERENAKLKDEIAKLKAENAAFKCSDYS